MQTPPVEAPDKAVRNDHADPSTAARGAALASAATKPKSRTWRLFHFLRKKVAYWWKIATSVAVALSVTLTVAVASYVVVLSLTRNTITIEPLSTPKGLADNGFTPEIAAIQLRAALGRALSAAQSGGPQMALRTEQPDLVVPSVGISAQAIANSIRKFLPISQAPIISGEFTVTDGQLWLTLRSGGRHIYSNDRGVSPEQIRQLMDAAAPTILGQVWPIYVARTLYRRNPALALEAADQVIARGSASDTGTAHLLKGIIYLEQRKHRRALASLATALQLEKQPVVRAQVHITRGRVFQQQKNSKKADEEFAKARELAKDDPLTLIVIHRFEGHPSMERSLIEMALAAELRKLAAKSAFEPGARTGVGSMFLHMGMRDEAITQYQEAIRLDPDDIVAHINLGTAYFLKGQSEYAAASYRKAIEINPRHEYLTTAYMTLGNILRDQNRLEEAAAEFRRVIETPLPTSFLRYGQGLHEQAPSYVDYHTRARNALGAVLRELGKLDEARAELTKNIDFEPRNADARLELAFVLRRQAEPEGAIAELRKAIELDPSKPAAYYHLALMLRDQGKPDEAIAEFQKIIKAAPHRPPTFDALAYRELGLILFDQQKTEEAVSNIQTAIKLSPEDAFAHLHLGIIFRSQGKLDDAISSLNEAARFGAKLSQPYFELAAIFRTQGKLDEAIDVLRKGLKREPEAMYAHVELAYTLRKRGDLDDAIAEFREILGRDPTNADSLYDLADTLTDKATERRSSGNVPMLVEACELLVKGKRLAVSDPGFAKAIKRVDRLMPRHRHCRSS